MAHIVEFSIKGLCGRKEEINLELNRDINVFFGQNGSGKTSLLKILHSAMSNDASILRDVPFAEAEVVIYSINKDRNYRYKIKKKLPRIPAKRKEKRLDEVVLRNWFVAQKDYENYFNRTFIDDQMRWEVSPETDISAWHHRYLPISRLYVGSVPSKTEEDNSHFSSEDQLDARFSKMLQYVWMMYSYNINTRVREAQEDGLANILRELLSPSKEAQKTGEKVPPREALDRVKRFLSRQKKTVLLDEKEFLTRYSSEPGMRSVVFDIDQVERNIEKAAFPIEKLNDLIHQLFGYGKKINFQGHEIRIELDDGTTITPQQLSSGEKHLLKLLIEVVSVDESSAIIDEPELSMHIDWQKALLQNMNVLNPQAQLIVATHSPEVMSKLEDRQIFRI